MSKNLFRKGLATGAIIALAAIGFTATPASAANEINVVPTIGSSYNTFGDSQLTLTSSLANGATLAHYEQFKYKIEVTGGTRAVAYNSCAYETASSYYEDWDNGDSGYQPGTNTQFPADADLITYCDQNREDFFEGYYSCGGSTCQDWEQNGWTTGWSSVNAGESVVVAGNAFDLSRNVLALEADLNDVDTSQDTTTTVKVTTFVDADNSNTFNGNEWNTVRTVNFKKYSEVVPTLTITQPKAGDTEVETKADFGDFNTEQAWFWNDFWLDNSGFDNYSTGIYPEDGNVDGGKMTFYDSAAGLEADDTVISKIYYYSDADNDPVLLKSSSASVTPHTISNLNNNNIELVESNDATMSREYYEVRQNKAFTMQLEVDDVQETPAPKAGVAVVGNVYSDYSLSDSRYVTVNGKKFTSASDLADEDFALTSDANGLVKLNIVPTGFEIDGSDNVFQVSFSAENYTNGWSYWIYLESTAWIMHTTDANDKLESHVRKSTFGVNNTVHYSVKDQFGVNANGMRLAYYTRYCDDGCYDYTDTKYDAPVTNGAATVTFTSPAGSDEWEEGFAWVQEQGSNGNWSDADMWDEDYYWIAFNTDTTASSFDDEGQDDECDSYGYVTDDATYTVDGHQAYDCEVESNTDGALITITAPGLGIELNGKIYLDTVSYWAPCYNWCEGSYDQDVDVEFYSYFVGDRAITLSMDGGVDVVNWSAYFYPGNAATMVVGTPAQAQAGQALDVPITVYDAHGNLTDEFWGENLLQTGVGYLLGGPASVTPEQVRDANGAYQTGKYNSKLVTGSSDLGTAFLNAKISTNYAFATASAIKVFKAVEFGTTDADSRASGKRVYVSYEFAMGRTLTVTIDGKRKYSKVITSDNAGQLSFYQKKKGLHTVTVRVSGGLVFTEKLTTK